MSTKIVNRIALAWIIIFPALHGIFGTMDGAGRIPSVLMLLGLILTIREENSFNFLKVTPFAIWILWDFIAALHWATVGINYTAFPDWVYCRSLFITVPVCMILSYHEAKEDTIGFTKFIIYVFLAYCLIGLLFQSAGTGQGTDWDARGGQTLGNDLPLNAIILAFFALFANVKKWISLKIMVGILAICLVCILFVATRKAFAAYLILLFFWGLSQIDLRKPQQILTLLIGGVVLYFGFTFIMDNTTLGMRFSEANDKKNVYATNHFLEFMGDRAYMYVMGWKMFLEHPFLGIGLNNFKPLTKTEFPLHSEYMVQLCECGLVGFSLFVSFYGTIIKWIRNIFLEGYKYEAIVFMGCIASILFISFTGWTYSQPRYFVALALIIAYCEPWDDYPDEEGYCEDQDKNYIE